MADIYEKEPKIITFEDGSIAKVWRPILTEEERARRMKEVEKAAIGLMKASMDAHKTKAV